MRIPSKTFLIEPSHPEGSDLDIELCVYEQAHLFEARWTIGANDRIDSAHFYYLYEYRPSGSDTFEFRAIEHTVESDLRVETYVLGGVVLQEKLLAEFQNLKLSKTIRPLIETDIRERIARLSAETLWRPDNSNYISFCLSYNTVAERRDEEGRCIRRIIKDTDPRIVLQSWQ